jgi:hypothetical protein
MTGQAQLSKKHTTQLWQVIGSNQDFQDYFETLVGTSLNVLDDKKSAKIYFEVFDHFSSALKDHLVGPKVKFITAASIASLEKDVLYLDGYVKKFPSATDSFTELLQLTNYGKSDSLEDILYPQMKRKYSRVETKDVITILQK